MSNPNTADTSVNWAPDSHLWDDLDTVDIKLGDRTIRVEVFDCPAPGRTPLGATLLGRPLFVSVEELPRRPGVPRGRRSSDVSPDDPDFWDDIDEATVRLAGGR